MFIPKIHILESQTLTPWNDLTSRIKRVAKQHVGEESDYNAGDPDLIPGWEYPLEKARAIHSSTLAWRIPWTEEPGGLQSMGLQGVRYD